MKMRDLARALGSARRPREYGWTVATFRLPGDGDVRLARWLHPAESLKFAATPEDGRFEFTYSDEGCCNGGLHAALGRWRATGSSSAASDYRGEELNRNVMARWRHFDIFTVPEERG